MQAKWSLPASLFCLAAAQAQVLGISAASSSSSTTTLAFGIVPSVPRDSSSKAGSRSTPPPNENESQNDALLRQLRANAVGIWSLKVLSGGRAGVTPAAPPRLLRATCGGAEDPWSRSGLPPSDEDTAEGRRRRQGRRSGGEPKATKPSNEATVLLNLREDGFFRQCNEGYEEGRWM